MVDWSVAVCADWFVVLCADWSVVLCADWSVVVRADLSVPTGLRLSVLTGLWLTGGLWSLSPGELEVFQGSEVAFWVTYCCLVLAVSLVMVRWPREVSAAIASQLTPYATHTHGDGYNRWQ